MRTTVLAFLLLVQSALPAAAQSQAQSWSFPSSPDQTTVQEEQPRVSFGSIFTDFGRELKRLPSKETAITLGIAGALALAVHPADRNITRQASSSEPMDEALDFGAAAGGGFAQAGVAIGAFAFGHAIGNRKIQEVGADLVQAQILTGVITQTIKIAADRTRPDSGRYSFPSGHSSGTFATATVLSRHFGWKVAVPAYGFATAVAASRLSENRHFASDVIFGAAIGIVAGRTFTVGTEGQRYALSPIAVPGGAGVTFTRLH